MQLMESRPDVGVRSAHALIQAAIRAGRERELQVIGSGEITTVVAWPPGQPRWALKRLPQCQSAGALSRYSDVVESYVRALEKAGVRVLGTRVESVIEERAAITGYLVQPLLNADDLLAERLRDATDIEASEWLEQIARSIRATAGASLGIDAHVSNWAVVEAGLTYFDVSTPLMRDGNGHDVLDLELFLAALPPLVRAPFRVLCLREVLNRYFDTESVANDFLGSLYQRGLERHVAVAAEHFARQGFRVRTLSRIRFYSRCDALLWRALRLARRAHRWFTRDVLGRAYGELLAWN